jgi:hypothetical protein
VGFVIELPKHLSMSSLTRVPYFPVTGCSGVWVWPCGHSHIVGEIKGWKQIIILAVSGNIYTIMMVEEWSYKSGLVASYQLSDSDKFPVFPSCNKFLISRSEILGTCYLWFFSSY